MPCGHLFVGPFICSFSWYILTYLLTPYSTVLLENLTGSLLAKKFHSFYVTRRFITAFTSAHHLSLSWASSIQSIPAHPSSWLHCERVLCLVNNELKYMEWGCCVLCLENNPSVVGVTGETSKVLNQDIQSAAEILTCAVLNTIQ